MATSLTFSQNSRKQWEASCTSSGSRMAVEIARVDKGSLIIYGSVGGMDKRIIHDFGPDAGKDVIFEIDVPADVEITITSFAEVVDAKIVGS